MKNISSELKVYTENKDEVLARVVLNGYRIQAGIAALPHGTMSSFMITDGDLWDAMTLNEALVLENEDGTEAKVRIAALPVDDDSFGLIEFM
ncbi:MAG: hypothetical protein ACE5FD_15285 [Anaerolineae bacterium]